MSVKPSHPAAGTGPASFRLTQHRPSRLAISVYSALLMMATLAVLPTQTAQAQSDSTVTAVQVFDVSAGPLNTALTQFARQAGINLVYDAALLAGKTSQGLSGSYAVRDGLARVLAGSDIEAQPRAGGGFSLRKIPLQETATQLSEIKVRGDGSLVTEGTDSYTVAAAATSSKLVLSPRETPQTLTVVTRQQIDDRGMTTVDEALKGVSGVYVWARGNNGNDYLSRGFDMQVQTDGLMDPIGIGSLNRAPMTDSAFVDRIEVLQGASGLLNGAGEPGGTINLVRKLPTKEFQAHAEAQLGSWNQRRVVGDVSGPLLSSGKLRGRLVALVDDSDSYVDYAFKDKRGVYGVLEADLGASTLARVSIQHQRDKSRDSLGVPMAPDGSDLGLGVSSFFANGRSESTKKDTIYTAGLHHRFGGGWEGQVTYSHRVSDVDISRGSFLWGGVLDVATGDGLSLYQHRYLTRRFKSDAVDAYASGAFDLFGRQHELAVGFNGSRMQEASRNSGNTVTPINVYHFDPDNLPDPAGVKGSLPNPNKNRQYGMYTAGRFNLADSWKLILGVRASWFQAKNAAGVTTQQENGKVSPYAGLVYDIDTHWSAYASYSDIFKPQSVRSVDGNNLKPIVGSNYEIGLKGEWLDGRLNASAALFRLEQTNLPQSDPSVPYDPGNACGGTCYIAQGKVKSEGLDVGINGEIATGWNLAAGYTYTRSKYAAGAQSGMPYRTDFPRHSFRLSTQYRIAQTDWSVGGNLTARSKIYRTGATYRLEQGAVVLLGLNARYRFSPQAELSFVVNNVFDKTYYEGLENLYYNPYGEPRSFSMNFRYQF